MSCSLTRPCSAVFRCAQLSSRVVKLSQELKEEQEMNRCLRANQAQLQSQLAEEERRGKESGEFNSVAAQRWSTLLDKHLPWRKSECFYGSALMTVVSGGCVLVCPSVSVFGMFHESH